MRVFGPVAIAAALALAGCASGDKLIGSDQVAVVQPEGMPTPTVADFNGATRPFVIGPLDTLSVDVYGLPELANRSAQVDSAGFVAVPLVGSVSAAGKTPAQVADEITRGLRAAHIREPKVAVNVTTVVSQVVTVDGAVRTPGIYQIQGRMTLLRTIARAEGLSEYARENYVVVFRRVGERNMAALYDVRAIRGGLYADPEIYANDVVFVGEEQARRLFQTALGATGILAGPLIAILR